MRAVELRVERDGQEPALGRARHQHFMDGDRRLRVEHAVTHDPNTPLLFGHEDPAIGCGGNGGRRLELVRERVEPELGPVACRQETTARGGGAGGAVGGAPAVAPVTVTRKAADLPLSATVAPSVTNEASSIE